MPMSTHSLCPRPLSFWDNTGALYICCYTRAIQLIGTICQPWEGWILVSCRYQGRKLSWKWLCVYIGFGDSGNKKIYPTSFPDHLYTPKEKSSLESLCFPCNCEWGIGHVWLKEEMWSSLDSWKQLIYYSEIGATFLIELNPPLSRAVLKV